MHKLAEQMMKLDRRQLVSVEGVPEPIYMTVMTVNQTQDFTRLQKKYKVDDKGNGDLVGLMSEVLVQHVTDETGASIFEGVDCGELPYGLVSRLLAKFNEVNATADSEGLEKK